MSALESPYSLTESPGNRDGYDGQVNERRRSPIVARERCEAATGTMHRLVSQTWRVLAGREAIS